MSRGPDGLTSVTVTWEPGAAPPRNQRVASVRREGDGERRNGALREPCRRRATSTAPRSTRRPGYIALEMAIQSSSGAALDTDYRGISVPNLQVTRPTFATPQVLRTRTAREFRRDEPERRRHARRVPNVQPHGAAAHTGAGLRPGQYAASRHRAPAQPARHPDARAAGRSTAPLPPGIVQFDLPLASLAPDEYRVELAAANPTGPRDEAKETASVPRDQLSRVILLLRIPD